jgi:hypothetical protein
VLIQALIILFSLSTAGLWVNGITAIVIASGRTMLLLILGEGILRVRVAIKILVLEDVEDVEDMEKNVKEDVEELVVVVVEREDTLLNVVL